MKPTARRVLICGAESSAVSTHLSMTKPDMILCPKGDGASKQAREWAQANDVTAESVSPSRIVRDGDPTLVLAFAPWDRATQRIAEAAARKGVTVLKVAATA